MLFTISLPATNLKESIYQEAVTVTNLPKAKEGHSAPNFKLKTLDGDISELSDYRGQKILLNFWASWCPPCKSEIPDLNDFVLESQKEKMVVVSVNMTYAEKNVQSVKAFQDMYKVKFPILLDQTSRIAELYGIRTIPTSYLINENGIIQKRIIGPLHKDGLKILLESDKKE